MAIDLSALFGQQPDYSQFISPAETQRMQSGANQSALLNAAIALLGSSGQTRQPISTGQILGSALGAGMEGYNQSFDRSLKQMVTGMQLSELKKKQDAQQRLQAAIQGATREVPQFGVVPTETGEMPTAETLSALTMPLAPKKTVDFAKLQESLMLEAAAQDPLKFLELTAKSEKAPSTVQEYEYAVKNGFKGSFTDYMARKTPSTNINVNTEKSYGGAVAGKIADIDAARYDIASRAPAVLDQVNRTKLILDSGNVFVGAFATPKLELARFGQELGVTGKNTDELVANTQTLMAGRAQATLDAVRASGLGAGQGFTDKDRQFLENARLGNITYSKKALQDQLDIEEKVARASVNLWNTRLEKIPASAKEPIGLEKIVLPETRRGGQSPTIPGVKRFNPATGKVE